MVQNNKYERQELALSLICITKNTACTSGFITHQNGKISGSQLKAMNTAIFSHVRQIFLLLLIGAIIFLFLFLYVSTLNLLIPLQAQSCLASPPSNLHVYHPLIPCFRSTVTSLVCSYSDVWLQV